MSTTYSHVNQCHQFNMLGRYKLLGLMVIAISSLVLWNVQIAKRGKQVLHIFSVPNAHESATWGVYNLLKRRMPLHADRFELSLVDFITNDTGNDQYMISSTPVGKIRVTGTTLSAICYGYVPIPICKESQIYPRFRELVSDNLTFQQASSILE